MDVTVGVPPPPGSGKLRDVVLRNTVLRPLAVRSFLSGPGTPRFDAEKDRALRAGLEADAAAIASILNGPWESPGLDHFCHGDLAGN
eukprot:11809772-Alexandrium_andersonii.AAC.1